MSDSQTVSRVVAVNTPNGLHMIPCSRICEFAAQFDSSAQLRFGERVADARARLELMSLGAGAGSQIELTAAGDDAQTLVDGLADLFDQGFPPLERNKPTGAD